MTKKTGPVPNPPPTLGAWSYIEGEAGWTGHKVFAAGTVTDVAGKTLDDVKVCAAEVDRAFLSRAGGLARQASERAAELRAQADALEAANP